VTERLRPLPQRIRDELGELEQVVQRAQEGWRRAQQSSDDFYLDSVALNLHGFYAGVERLFMLIAGLVDGTQPGGANWHQVVLRMMAEEVPRVRPAVISPATYEALDEYRAFRHLVRNVYTFHLDPARVARLVQLAPAAMDQVSRELLAFADFLEQRGKADG
jgi:hypothetical protein